MAVTPKILASGQLGTTVAALYTATGNTYISSIFVTNVSGADRTVYIYGKASAGSDVPLAANALVMSSGDCLTLKFRGGIQSGDAIRGYTDTASAVSYIIFGGTE